MGLGGVGDPAARRAADPPGQPQAPAAGRSIDDYRLRQRMVSSEWTGRVRRNTCRQAANNPAEIVELAAPDPQRRLRRTDSQQPRRAGRRTLPARPSDAPPAAIAAACGAVSSPRSKAIFAPLSSRVMLADQSRRSGSRRAAIPAAWRKPVAGNSSNDAPPGDHCSDGAALALAHAFDIALAAGGPSAAKRRATASASHGRAGTSLFCPGARRATSSAANATSTAEPVKTILAANRRRRRALSRNTAARLGSSDRLLGIDRGASPD